MERKTNLVTAGDIVFAKAGPKLWTILRTEITSAESLNVFKKMKMHLFIRTYSCA